MPLEYNLSLMLDDCLFILRCIQFSRVRKSKKLWRICLFSILLWIIKCKTKELTYHFFQISNFAKGQIPKCFNFKFSGKGFNGAEILEIEIANAYFSCETFSLKNWVDPKPLNKRSLEYILLLLLLLISLSLLPLHLQFLFSLSFICNFVLFII